MINPQWLFPCLEKNFHGLKDVQAIEVRLFVAVRVVFVQSVFVSALFSGIFLYHSNLIRFLIGECDCCGFSWISLYVYYLILKEDIPTCKETKVIIPLQVTTQFVQQFDQVTQNISKSI